MTAGVKRVGLGDAGQSVVVYDQGTTPSLLHHNAHSIFSDEVHGLVYVGTIRGITVMSPTNNASSHFELPSGEHLLDLHLWPEGSSDGVLLLTTNRGMMTLSLDEEGQISSVLDVHDDWGSASDSQPQFELITPLQTGSGAQLDLIAFAAEQQVWRFSLDSEGLIVGLNEVIPLTDALQQQENTTVEVATHVVLPSEGGRLFVGTDLSLIHI